MSERYRQELRVAAKLMLWVAIFAVLYVFVKGMFSGGTATKDVPTQVVEVGHWTPGDTQAVNWSGRPVIIHRRTADEMQALERVNEQLLNPGTDKLEITEWFVGIALGADFACAVEYLPPNEELFAGSAWPGGYIDACRGHRYDGAGRVYKDQAATENLIIPNFQVRDTRLILGAS